MNLINDQPVFDIHGEKIGEVDRVVMDPRTDEVTHLVVRKGFLFTEDRVLPIELVKESTPERVVLDLEDTSVEAFPEFEESHYVRIHDKLADNQQEAVNSPEFVRSVYWYPPAGAAYTSLPGYPLHAPYVIEKIDRNIPDETVPLHEGANVYSHDGDHVGDVERVLIDTESNQASHLLVSEGILFKEKKVVPMSWVDDVLEDKVQLATDSRLLEALPDYVSSN